MNEILTIIMIVLAIYPLKIIYTLFRICEKRKNKINMYGSITFAIMFLMLLLILDNLALQFGLIVITALVADKLIKKYMALISHEENEKRLDSFEAFIKAYEQQKQSK